jgi:hypothetical protein
VKISCTFDRAARAFTLEPEDPLELALLEEVAKRADNGQLIKVVEIKHQSPNSADQPKPGDFEFRFSMEIK